MKKSRLWLFNLIACLIPVLFFVLLEFSLRAIDYGHQHPLFIENPEAPHYLLPKPDVVKRYFPKGAPSPSVTIETNFFLKKKPEDGIRIFVQGGSTAAGFPYGLGASIAGMLDYRLKQSFPDKSVEVVNTALSAVNSYTVLDFSDEIIAQKPDAVLMYMGHNEYLGILGVGSNYSSTNSSASTLLFLKLYGFKTFQLIQNIYWSFKSPNANIDQSKSRSFMSKVAKHKNIPKDSPLFTQGIQQFETNLELLVNKYKEHNIPVFIATIASNLADQKPFSSVELPDNIKGQVESLLSTETKNIREDEVANFRQLADQYGSADIFYLLGRHFEQQNNYGAAREHYIAARDHDLLRFRAPSEINVLIEKITRKHELHLVHANQYLEENSPNGIIGSEMMIEHLHPTAEGYFHISDAFYHALNTSKIFGDFPRVMKSKDAINETPLLDAELFWAEAKIAGLIADYPFVDEPVEAKIPTPSSWSEHLGFQAYKKKIGWFDLAKKTLEHRKSDTTTKITAIKLMAEALPYNESLNFEAGKALIHYQRPQEALRYLRRAIDISPKNTNNQLALAHALLILKRYDTGRRWLNSVLAIDPNNQTAKQVSAQLKAINK